VVLEAAPVEDNLGHARRLGPFSHERADRLGGVLMGKLEALAARHPSVGEVRGRGLLACIELVRDRSTREPLTPQRTEAPVTAAMAEVRAAILGRRVSPLFRWNLIGLTPPLTISEEELDEGLAGIEAGLEVADWHVAAAV